eukprot:1020690-Pelagomonas_calceolata.AAC.2
MMCSFYEMSKRSLPLGKIQQCCQVLVGELRHTQRPYLGTLCASVLIPMHTKACMHSQMRKVEQSDHQQSSQATRRMDQRHSSKASMRACFLLLSCSLSLPPLKVEGPAGHQSACIMERLNSH